MKYCSHCGKELCDEAVICTECGCFVENKPEPKTDQSISALAIVGFVCAFCMPLVGLICSIIALNKAKSAGDVKSKPFAVAGVAISAVSIAVILFYLLIYFGFIFILIYGLTYGSSFVS